MTYPIEKLVARRDALGPKTAQAVDRVAELVTLVGKRPSDLLNQRRDLEVLERETRAELTRVQDQLAMVKAASKLRENASG